MAIRSGNAIIGITTVGFDYGSESLEKTNLNEFMIEKE